jgi:hypothetical protein
VHRQGRPSLEGETSVEARHAVGVGGGDGKTPARILERASTHPTHAILERVEDRQEQMPALARGTTAVSEVVVLSYAGAAFPQRFGGAEESIDRRDLLSGRRSPGGPDVH